MSCTIVRLHHSCIVAWASALFECPRRQTLLSLLLCVRVAWPWQAHRSSQGVHAFPRHLHLSHVSPLVPVRTASSSNPTKDTGEGDAVPHCTKLANSGGTLANRPLSNNVAACEREREGSHPWLPERLLSHHPPFFRSLKLRVFTRPQPSGARAVHFPFRVGSLRQSQPDAHWTKGLWPSARSRPLPQASTLAGLWPYRT